MIKSTLIITAVLLTAAPVLACDPRDDAHARAQERLLREQAHVQEDANRIERNNVKLQDRAQRNAR